MAYVHFILLGFHCWLRPAELLGLLWGDLLPIYDEGPSCGILCIGNPIIRFPLVKHVVIECPRIRDTIVLLRAAFQGEEGSRIFPWTPYQLTKRWSAFLARTSLTYDTNPLTVWAAEASGSRLVV